jgi:CubicO group peptidase (beta-lactamase class C family)
MKQPSLRSIPIVMLLALGACRAGGQDEMKVPAANAPQMIQARKLLDAINSGDRATQEAYRKENFSPDWQDPPDAERGLMSHKQFGGFDLVQVDESLPNQMHGWVRARDSDAVLELALDVEPAAPHRLTFLHLDWGNAPEKFRVARLPEAAVIEAWRQDTARRAQEDKFSGAILLTRGDQVLLREAYGFADRDAKVPNTVETRFRTASTSKMFTAVAVLRLVQDGKLKLEDRIDKIVPGLAGKPVAPATIHQLLSHTAGAGDFFGPRYDAHKKELQVHDDYVRFFGGDALVSKPGEKFQYSNLGYMYLGAAIEHASGRSFYDYLEQAVFAPAGMAHTDTSPADVDMRGRARGYIRPPGERAWRSAAEFLDYRPDGAGGAWSTIDDLQRFLAALRANRLLGVKYTQLMLEQKAEAWKGHGYGYGVWIDNYPGGGLWLGGMGGEMGSNSQALFNPGSNYQVIVLSNFDPGAAIQVSEFVRARLPLR